MRKGNHLLHRRGVYGSVAMLTLLLLGTDIVAHAASTAVADIQGQDDATQATQLEEAQRLNEQSVGLYHAGKYQEAIPLAERALGIREQVLGPHHPEVATSLNNLAALYGMQGTYAQAEPLHQRAVQIFERTLGPHHPYVGFSLGSLVALFAVKNDITQAIAYQARANAIDERNMALNLVTGSEHQKRFCRKFSFTAL